ncbi:MAG: hypothetical protein ACPLX7_01270 [Candidatus Kapaibacteriota bacterium]
MIKKIKCVSIIVFTLLIAFSNLHSQIVSLFPSDTIATNNHFYQIFDKQFNIHRFFNSLFFSKNFNKTILSINNEYEGFLILSNEDSKKDAERFNFFLSQNLFSYFQIFGETNYYLNSDSKTIGLNEAERQNGNLGISFNAGSSFKTFVSYGIEKNKQVTITQQGPRFSLVTKLDKINFSTINLRSNLSVEKVLLKDGRQNSNISFQTQINGLFDEQNTLFLGFDYQSFRRDYIVFPIYTNNFFESRFENKIFPSFNLTYNLFNQTFLSFSGQIYSYKISRYYNLFDPTNQYTATERTLYEQSLDLNFEIFSQSPIFSPRLGFYYFFRNEENVINKRFFIDNQTFNQLSTTENQKNNSQTRLKIFYNIILKPNTNNLTALFGNISILRYDTPSQLNDDDRDEFQFFSTLSSTQKISNYYSLTVSLDLQFYHLVFLKSTRSSLNNWNRILRLGISSNYQTDIILWKPTFEIFSNYLVYDYETSNIQSYAFRQFLYRDSLTISISKSLTLANFVVYKYSERGTLFWKDFAMTKETEIEEIFTKTMFFYLYNSRINFGIGARIYNITQTPVGKSNFSEGYYYYSFSPETEIKFFLGKNNVIFLQGWYELKFGNYKIVGKNPNFMIMTRVNL